MLHCLAADGAAVWQTCSTSCFSCIMRLVPSCRCPLCVQGLLRSNAADNAEAIKAAGGHVDVAELTWGQPQLPQGWHAPDFVLAADLVYHRHLYEPLLQTLQQFGAFCNTWLPADDDPRTILNICCCVHSGYRAFDWKIKRI